MFHKEIRNNNFLLVSLFDGCFSVSDFEELIKYISENKFIKYVGLNFNYAKYITNELLEILVKLAKIVDVSLYRMQSENLVPFYLMRYNKFISVFETEEDCVKRQNPVVSRNFSVCR